MELIDIRHVSREEFGMCQGFQPTRALFFITKGSFALSFDGKEQNVGQHDLVYFPKEMYFKRHVQSSLSFYYLRFSGTPVIDLPRGLQRIHHKDRMAATFSYLHQLCQSVGADEALKEHFFRDILYQCGAEFAFLRQGGELKELLSYMEKNYQEPLSIDRLAAMAGLSNSGLILKFKREFGVTPMQYVISLRMNRAKALLADTDLPVGEVARQCGYACPYFFSNSFKRQVGDSPREFRQKNGI